MSHQLAHYEPPVPAPWAPVYEDAHVLVVDKPAGLLTVPGRGPGYQDCLLHRVQQHVPDALLVHRLDMDTSGLVMLAKGAEAQRHLSRLFMQRNIDKTYEAVVHGEPEELAGTVQMPLLVDWPNRPRQKVDWVHGKPAVTHYECLGSQEDAAGRPTSRLHLHPVTGRSHQLRVHCQAIGHPIVGDRLYGTACDLDIETRLKLHAKRLAFIHPFTLEPVLLTSPCPF